MGSATNIPPIMCTHTTGPFKILNVVDISEAQKLQCDQRSNISPIQPQRLFIGGFFEYQSFIWKLQCLQLKLIHDLEYLGRHDTMVRLLLENPLSGIYYPLMLGILCVMGLEGISVYPLTDTDTLH